MSTVKPVRPYDSSGRRRQAQESRDAILDAALRLFLEKGYARTTMAEVADGATVSVETVYKAFGGKAGLVRAIRSQALAGDGPVPAEVRSDRMRATEPDPRMVIARWTELSTEVMPRVAPILLVLRSAAEADASLAPLRDELDASRRARMADNARHLYERGDLQVGITADEATDILFVYSSPELYELLVLRQGWPIARFGEFTARAITSALLNPPDLSTNV